MIQLEITVPDNVEPNQLLAIPVSEDEETSVNVQVRLPEGLGPGDIFFLCKESPESTQWMVNVPEEKVESVNASTFLLPSKPPSLDKFFPSNLLAGAAQDPPTRQESPARQSASHPSAFFRLL